MVAPEFWSSNLAVQASWADSWALDPAPAISPEAPSESPLALEPQAVTVRARRAEAAETSHHFLFIESLLFRIPCMSRPSQRPGRSLLRSCGSVVKRV